MEVIKYLKQHGIKALEEEFAIKAKIYGEGLIVLNYDQIYSSPKAHPIVAECRGLILDSDFNVVSRSFDRFFNLGEQPDTQIDIDISKTRCYEKIDGSLIKIYCWKGNWYISTRGTAFAESDVNGFPLTFEQLVHKAINVESKQAFQYLCEQLLNPDFTYICEITSAENRVVKQYNGYQLYYLAVRNNLTGYYTNDQEQACEVFMSFPKAFSFDSVENCIETAKHLKDLDEGYVLYQDGVPRAKVKSPVYVAVHNIRGEGLSPKRIAQIVLSGESEEYLKYFPEDESFFIPYFDAQESLDLAIHTVYEATMKIEDQKQFALEVKDYPFSAVLFQCKKTGKHPQQVFAHQTEPSKIRMLEAFLEAA